MAFARSSRIVRGCRTIRIWARGKVRPAVPADFSEATFRYAKRKRGRRIIPSCKVHLGRHSRPYVARSAKTGQCERRIRAHC